MTNSFPNTFPLIDSYLHVGQPRFGSAPSLLKVLQGHPIEKANIVLGPGTPDFAALRAMRSKLGDRVRLFGIPFGETEEQRTELAEFQIKLGVSGFRFMPFEMKSSQAALQLAGENGLWLLAINPYQSADYARQLLAWLEDHPKAHVCSPHFLIPSPLAQVCDDTGPLIELLRHPRFFATLSRHGGVGSQRPFPHQDLRPWLEDLIENMGWEKLMWGSEYPVLYWRGEHIPQSAEWMGRVFEEASQEQAKLFLRENAERLFFSDDAPGDQAGDPPAQWARRGDVPYFNGALPMPMAVHEKLLERFVNELPDNGEASIRQTITVALDRAL